MAIPPFQTDWSDIPSDSPGSASASNPPPKERKSLIIEGRDHPALEAIRDELSQVEAPSEDLLKKGEKILNALDVLKFKYALRYKMNEDLPALNFHYSNFLKENDPQKILTEAENFPKWVEEKKESLKIIWSLELNDSDVRHIPEEASALKNLRIIDLTGNPRLTSLPDTLLNLPHLKTIKADCPSLERCWA